MNVYAWHPDPTRSARGLATLHLGHLLLQATQLLATALKKRGLNVVAKTLVHPNKLVKRLAEDPAFFEWVYLYAKALADEYASRTGKVHASVPDLLYLNSVRLKVGFAAAPIGMKDWPVTLPEAFSGEDPHDSYRKFLTSRYIALAKKTRIEWPLGHSGSPWAPRETLGAAVKSATKEIGPFPFSWELTPPEKYLPDSLAPHWNLLVKQEAWNAVAKTFVSQSYGVEVTDLSPGNLCYNIKVV